MEKYENIMKLIDESIAKYESDVKWYREHYHQATDEVANLTKAIEVLKKKIEELEEELDFWKPNKCKGEDTNEFVRNDN